MFPKNGSMNRRLASLHWLQPGEVRQLQRYYQDAMTPCCHPAALRFLRLAVPRLHSLLRSLTDECAARGLELVTRYLQPGIRRGANRVLPSSWGTSIVRLHMFQSDAGRTACTRPYSAAAWPLVIKKQRLPRLGLSTLNSMAFGLAVYASQCGLLQHHARLASSCWSGSTGRASHPQGSDERFQSCRLHLIPLSQALLGATVPTLPRHKPPGAAEPCGNQQDFPRPSQCQTDRVRREARASVPRTGRLSHP